MRILTGTEVLAPAGGIEVCVYEDSIALADRGHAVELLYTRDGVQRSALEQHGISLQGPERFLFDPRHPMRDLASFVRSGREVRQLGVDVLWLNRPENVAWAQVVSRIARVPLVVHLHHAPNYRLERQTMCGVARFIAVSEYMKSVWSAVGVPPMSASRSSRTLLLSRTTLSRRWPSGSPLALDSAWLVMREWSSSSVASRTTRVF